MTVFESSDKQISLLFQFDEELAKKLKVKDRAHFWTCTNFFDRAKMYFLSKRENLQTQFIESYQSTYVSS